MSEEKENKIIVFGTTIALAVITTFGVIVSSRGGMKIPTIPEDTSGNTTLTYVRNSTYSVKEDNKTYTSSVTTKGGTTVYLYGYNSQLPGDNYVARINSTDKGAYYLLFASDANGTPFQSQGLVSITINAYVGTTPGSVKFIASKNSSFTDTSTSKAIVFKNSEQTYEFPAGYYYLKIEGSTTLNIYSISLVVGCANH